MTTVIAKHEIRRQHPSKEGTLEIIAPGTSFEASGEELEFFRSKDAVYKSAAQARAMQRAQEGIRVQETLTGTEEVGLNPEIDENTTAKNRSTAAAAETARARRAAAEPHNPDDLTRSEKLGQEGGEAGVAGSLEPRNKSASKEDKDSKDTKGRRLT